MNWPADPAELIAAQVSVARLVVPRWTPPERYLVGGVWICFPRGLSGPGMAGDRAWVAAVVMDGSWVVGRQVGGGAALAAYTPGLLALRVGPLLEDVVRCLAPQPDVLLVDGTGRDHPRRAGLALHLGAVLDLPTVGVTHRPLIAVGDWPDDVRGATAPVRVDNEQVATWLRTRAGTRPLVVHPGWRTDVSSSVQIVSSCLAGRRTPEPLRQARRAARVLRGP